MSKINGYDNEYAFVKLFNQKPIKNLDPVSRELIDTLFNYKNDLSIITCWKNHYKQKADIMIKIENHIKGISIKKGIKNSVHAEGISYFVDFLKENNVPLSIIKEYLKFHYADGTINGKGKKKISTNDYKLEHQDKIDIINSYFNNEQFISKCINRFIITGANSIYPISALIYGEPNDYIFILPKEIQKMIIMKKDMKSTGIHIGSLQVQPKNRCLNNNSKYEKDRYYVQIKWYNLFDNYIEYKYIQKTYKY